MVGAGHSKCPNLMVLPVQFRPPLPPIRAALAVPELRRGMDIAGFRGRPADRARSCPGTVAHPRCVSKRPTSGGLPEHRGSRRGWRGARTAARVERPQGVSQVLAAARARSSVRRRDDG